MDYETGDIIVHHSWPGHVMLAYSSTELIHAQRVRGFHKVPVQQEINGIYTYGDYRNAHRYRPDWSKVTNAAQKQQEMQQVADNILNNSTYGAFRALRLGLGSNIFGPGAKSRLAKYTARKNNGTGEGLVKTITCVEATVLCYQLIFADGDPLFIRLDAAHTMPATLGNWLESSPNWTGTATG